MIDANNERLVEFRNTIPGRKEKRKIETTEDFNSKTHRLLYQSSYPDLQSFFHRR